MMTTIRRSVYGGVFLIALSTLMYELLLTRIFSVSMWYHYAFMAISLAMFGMTAGALFVYLAPRYFRADRSVEHMAGASILFAVTIVLSFLTHLSIPFVISWSAVGLYSMVLNYVVIALPFIFSGIAICLALTRFPEHVGRLYAADLCGAGVGCVLLIYLLDYTDGPTSVIVVAGIASAGALALGMSAPRKSLRWVALGLTLLLGSSAAVHTVMVQRGRPFLRLLWVKGAQEPTPIFEKWNSFSRIQVARHGWTTTPFGWGLSNVYPKDRKVDQLGLDIDAFAGTVLTRFDGNIAPLEHLKFDVTNIAHYIRPDSRVLVVGTGGGRDILSALAFGQKAVVGVEINKDIIDAVNGRFGEFTGHLDRHPRVTFVNDEARSYVARHTETFDILQVSLIDTFAATAAGAFVLTENSLYTVEAWDIFLQRLSANGVLTFSRWYFRDRPGEVYRLASLAAASLSKRGVKNLRDHIVIVRHLLQAPSGEVEAPDGVGTILVSPSPFSDADLDVIDDIARRMQFDVVLSRRVAVDETFAELTSGVDVDAFAASFPINIAPPTDNTPFFFNMLRPRDLFKSGLTLQGKMSLNLKAVFVLGVALLTVGCLTLGCIIVPLLLTTDRAALRGAGSLTVFFAAIGFGFMLVEMSQMQRLMIFLGHPTYGLSVVLFGLLVSSGIGSLMTQTLVLKQFVRGSMAVQLVLLLVLVVFGLGTPWLISYFESSSTGVRIAAALAVIFPLGLCLGTAFPLGMRLATMKSPSLTPWLWGVNGATSVCASVLAVVLAIAWSISTAFWVGFSCYVIAAAAFLLAARKQSLREWSEAATLASRSDFAEQGHVA